jgi:hypothetical protein
MPSLAKKYRWFPIGVRNSGAAPFTPGAISLTTICDIIPTGDNRSTLINNKENFIP